MCLHIDWLEESLQPSVEEVIEGCNTKETPITYYAKEMRYPKQGGYKSYLKELVKDADIRYNLEVFRIDTLNKIVYFTNGETAKFDRLISSLPLPLVAQMCDAPDEVMIASNKLECTSGYHISVGLKTKNIPPYLWWYIYDEDILASRVYSPSLKSPDNVPEGCSSLQFEVSCKEFEYTEQEYLTEQ